MPLEDILGIVGAGIGSLYSGNQHRIIEHKAQQACTKGQIVEYPSIPFSQLNGNITTPITQINQQDKIFDDKVNTLQQKYYQSMKDYLQAFQEPKEVPSLPQEKQVEGRPLPTGERILDFS